MPALLGTLPSRKLQRAGADVLPVPTGGGEAATQAAARRAEARSTHICRTPAGRAATRHRTTRHHTEACRAEARCVETCDATNRAAVRRPCGDAATRPAGAPCPRRSGSRRPRRGEHRGEHRTVDASGVLPLLGALHALAVLQRPGAHVPQVLAGLEEA